MLDRFAGWLLKDTAFNLAAILAVATVVTVVGFVVCGIIEILQ